MFGSNDLNKERYIRNNWSLTPFIGTLKIQQLPNSYNL